MKLSDRYRQSFCDIYPETRNLPKPHLAKTAFVGFVLVLGTALLSFLQLI